MQHPDTLVRRAAAGDLPLAEQHALRVHLSACGHCHTQLADQELLDARLRDLPYLTPSRDFAATVRAQVAALPAPRYLPPWPLTLTLALLGLLGIWLTYAELAMLLGNLAATSYALWQWLLAFARGSGSQMAQLSWPSGGLDPLLLFALCLIGGASALVLQRTLTETALEACDG